MKRWLRREVLMPLLFLALYGGALYFLNRKLQELRIFSTKSLLAWLFLASVAVYAVLLITTFHHIASAYLLERYDPGDTGSVRRLSRRLRFRMSSRWNGAAFVRDFLQVLRDDNFELEGGDRRSGFVFARASLDFWTRRPLYDRVLMIETGPINVFRVDQLIKETIDQLDHVERPSRRNVLIIAVSMDSKRDAASAAAGCVNYMGRFQSGTLFPVLVDMKHRRMYYPVNRSFFSRAHRGLYSHVLYLIRSAGLRSEAQALSGEPYASVPESTGEDRLSARTASAPVSAGTAIASPIDSGELPADPSGGIGADIPQTGIPPADFSPADFPQQADNGSEQKL